MLKVVFDTNVCISALITKGGKAEEAYLLAIEKKIKLFISISILTGTAKKLREKFQWDDENIRIAVKHISTVAGIVNPIIKINILKDKPDNRILECAKEAGADFIVAGDKPLLVLQNYEGINIIRISDILKKIKEA